MSAERRRPWPLVAGLALLAFLFVAVIGYRHSSEHVRRISGNEWASLDCVPCHVLSKQDGPLARLLHRQYLSPLDIAVADDGAWLYVTAEESDVLLAVDLCEKRVASANENFEFGIFNSARRCWRLRRLCVRIGHGVI